MNNDPKGVTATFSQLVKAKLKERKWSQAELGRRISKGAAYMSYLVRGADRNVRGRAFRPSPDIVRQVARELDIPPDEAFQAAGYDPALLSKKGTLPDDPPPGPGEQNVKQSAKEKTKK